MPVTVSEASEPSPGRSPGPKAGQLARSVETSGAAIEIELGAAKLTVRGPVDREQLRLVLDALVRYR